MGSSKYFFGCFNSCFGCIGLSISLIFCVVIWQFWWGKAVIIAVLCLYVIFIYKLIKEAIFQRRHINENKNPIHTVAELDEDELRKKAFFYATEDFTNNPNEYTESNLNSYHRWIKDPQSEPEIENWFQENKEHFMQTH